MSEGHHEESKKSSKTVSNVRVGLDLNNVEDNLWNSFGQKNPSRSFIHSLTHSFYTSSFTAVKGHNVSLCIFPSLFPLASNVLHNGHTLNGMFRTYDQKHSHLLPWMTPEAVLSIKTRKKCFFPGSEPESKPVSISHWMLHNFYGKQSTANSSVIPPL